MGREGTCRGCGAPIYWMGYTKKSGEVGWMPVDPDDDGQPPHGEEYDRETMISHFSTCPEADKFRRKKK